MSLDHFLVDVELHVAGDLTQDEFEAVLDQLAERAVAVRDGVDGDVSAESSSRTLTLHFSLDARTAEAAFARGVEAAREVLGGVASASTVLDKVTLAPVRQSSLFVA